MPKKKWEKPKLVVLVRGRPEEVVLQGCKGYDVGGPFTDYRNCGGFSPCAASCDFEPTS